MGITECQRNLEIGDHRVPKHWGSQGAKKIFLGTRWMRNLGPRAGGTKVQTLGEPLARGGGTALPGYLKAFLYNQ